MTVDELKAATASLIPVDVGWAQWREERGLAHVDLYDHFFKASLRVSTTFEPDDTPSVAKAKMAALAATWRRHRT